MRSVQQEHSQLLSEVELALRALDNVHILHSRDEVRFPQGIADKVLEVEVLEQPARIVIEAKLSSYPRDMQLAAERVARYARNEQDLVTIPMVVAPMISPGGRVVLRERGVAYWDRSGSLYLPLPWAHYDIARPTLPGNTRKLRSLYHGRTAQALHALLHEPNRSWHVGELAEEAHISAYTAHRVLVEVEQRLWAARSGSGPQTIRQLRDPGALLDDWAAGYTLTSSESASFFGWARSAAALRRQVTSILEQHNVDYALTLGAGADLVAPFATGQEHVAILIPPGGNLAQIAVEARLRPATTGTNVTFFITDGAGPLLYRQRINDVWVASAVQLYLDLWGWPQRGREQATHLRRECLAF